MEAGFLLNLGADGGDTHRTGERPIGDSGLEGEFSIEGVFK